MYCSFGYHNGLGYKMSLFCCKKSDAILPLGVDRVHCLGYKRLLLLFEYKKNVNFVSYQLCRFVVARQYNFIDL